MINAVLFKKIKWQVLITVIFLFMFILIPVTVMGANFQIETAKKILHTREEIQVKVKLVDEDQKIIPENKQLMVRVDRGGLLEQKQLKTGIMLKEGEALFTYLAPELPGEARLTLLDFENMVSREIVFEILKESIEGKWEKQFANLGEITGKVLVKSSTQDYWDIAQLDKKLYEGDTIKTWKDSWATLNLFDGSSIVMEPLTKVVIKTLSSLKEDSNVKKGIFELMKGKVLCTANNFINKGSQFSIETESAAAGVRGTYFEVIYTDEKEITVVVYTGSVRVEHRTTERVFVVNKGQKIKVPSTKKDPEIAPHNETEEKRKEKLDNEKKKNVQNKKGDNKSKDKEDDDEGSVTISPEW